MEPTDIPAMVRLAIDSQMFPEEAHDFLAGSAQQWFDAGQSPARWVVDDEAGEVVGVAFFEPREATDRVWYLTMIVVSQTVRGTGRGRGLLTYVEDQLRSENQRLLLIETSGTTQYDGTRRFYEGGGYREVARIPDYFEDGDAMVLYKKDLRVSS